MIINLISYYTVLTFILLSKFDLLTCIEIPSSHSSSHTTDHTNQSFNYTNSSVVYSDNYDSSHGPIEVLIKVPSHGTSQTFSSPKLSQDGFNSDPQHIILSSLPSETLPGSKTSQIIPVTLSSEVVPGSFPLETRRVFEDSGKGTVNGPTESKPSSEPSETGSGTEPLNAEPLDNSKVQLLIIDVDNKKSTNEAEYKRDETHEFDIFTAKEGFFIYSVKKRGDRLWKSRNKKYPIGIAYKERTNDKPLLRVFHKGDDPLAMVDSTPDPQEQVLPAEIEEGEDKIEVIEVRKPTLSPGSPTHLSDYTHRAVDLGYQSDSDDGFSSDDESSDSEADSSDPNRPKPKYRPSRDPPPVTYMPTNVEVASTSKQAFRIGTTSTNQEMSINLTQLNEKIATFAADLDKLSRSINIGTSGTTNLIRPPDYKAVAEPSPHKSSIEVEDFGTSRAQYTDVERTDQYFHKPVKSEDDYGFILGNFDTQMVESYSGENESSQSARISHLSDPVTVQSTPYGSDQEAIESLYGKGVKFETTQLDSRPTAVAAAAMDYDDIVIVDPRASLEPAHFTAPEDLSHGLTVFSFPGSRPFFETDTDVSSEIPREIEIPRQKFQKFSTISYDQRILNDTVLSEPVVDPGIYTNTMIKIPKYEYAKLRGFPGPGGRARRLLPYRTSNLATKARNLKIYTTNEHGIIYENDTSNYDITKGPDMYTYTFHISAKCFMIKYKDKEWIHDPFSTLVTYPSRILLSKNNIRIEFRST